MGMQHTIRTEDAQGREVIITMGVTRDRLIAVRRSTGGVVLFTPRAVSRFIQCLRDLQTEALQGETWRVE